jgi:hypothetical protein
MLRIAMLFVLFLVLAIPLMAQDKLATIQNPSDLATLQYKTVTFRWNAVAGASEYWLQLGSSYYNYDLHNKSAALSTQVTVSGLPTDGRMIFATMWTLIGRDWFAKLHFFNACNGCGEPPQTAVNAASVPINVTIGTNPDSLKIPILPPDMGGKVTIAVGTSYGDVSVLNADITGATSVTVPNVRPGKLFVTLTTNDGKTTSVREYVFMVALSGI